MCIFFGFFNDRGFCMPIILSAVLIGFTNYFLTTRLNLHRTLDGILVNFLLVCANIVLTFEITSLLGLLNQKWAFISIQGVWLVFAFLFYYFLGKNTLRPQRKISDFFKEFFSFCRQHRLFTIFLIIVSLSYLFLAYLSIIFPQNTSDSLYNHLSRVAHWLQQGSLAPFDSFNLFGITYPYNNSLLMMWSMLFTRADRLVGLVQWSAAIMLALSIYGLAIRLGFNKEQAGFSALIFLTFPIVILESMTAQNDILGACFFLIGIYFFLIGFQESSDKHILFSAISIALAAGTKQYIAFAIPGFLLILVYFSLKKENPRRAALAINFVLYTLAFTLLLGSYAYIQNTIYYHNPIGAGNNIILSPVQSDGTLVDKLAYNSARLTIQFISCEGLPLPLEDKCLAGKEFVFTRIFSNPNFNLESPKFTLEANCGSGCFAYRTRNPLNEESAWFGFLSWILIIPGAFLVIIASIRKKDALPVLILVTAVIYFLIISVFKAGWDPYLGRYLILSVALVIPFIGYFFNNRNILQKSVKVVITILAIFILMYTILSNDSKPILGKQTMVNLQLWGKTHALVVTKIAYKLTPWIKNDYSNFSFDFNTLRTASGTNLIDPVNLVTTIVPETGSLGIISDNPLFLDYLFFGDPLSRKVYELTNYIDPVSLALKIQKDKIDYVLISPKIAVTLPAEFQLMGKSNDWRVYANDEFEPPQ